MLDGASRREQDQLREVKVELGIRIKNSVDRVDDYGKGLRVGLQSALELLTPDPLMQACVDAMKHSALPYKASFTVQDIRDRVAAASLPMQRVWTHQGLTLLLKDNDVLTARVETLMEALRAITDKFPTPTALNETDDDQLSGRRKLPMNFTYAEIRACWAALTGESTP